MTEGDAPGDGGDRHPGSRDGGDRDRDEPLSDLREDVERRRERGGGDAFEELFADVDVDAVDEDDVWTELSSGESPFVEPDLEAFEPVDGASGGRDGDADGSRDAGEDGDVRVVEKRLCHGCPHFADPPETACTHEGTTIDAEVDTDHFRVVNCPVVAAREESEASDFSGDES
jgi:hypothetical protein